VLTPLTLARIETGRVKRVPIDDLLALAYVLEVSPLFLLLPYDVGTDGPSDGEISPPGSGEVTLASGLAPFSGNSYRAWLRGESPLPGQDSAAFFRELPPDELAERLGVSAQTVFPAAPRLAASATGTRKSDEAQSSVPDTKRLEDIRERVARLSGQAVLEELGSSEAEFEAWLVGAAVTVTSRVELRRRTMWELRRQLVGRLASQDLAAQRVNPPGRTYPTGHARAD
jgi:transcriptional regulator with XRE-family HTH domain